MSPFVFNQRSDNRIKQRCVIDEAWSPLAPDSHAVAAAFILSVIRTARKERSGLDPAAQGHVSDLVEHGSSQEAIEHPDAKEYHGEGV